VSLCKSELNFTVSVLHFEAVVKDGPSNGSFARRSAAVSPKGGYLAAKYKSYKRKAGKVSLHLTN
jgi:hypothetical protein